MPRYFKFWIETGFAGATHEEVVEITDKDVDLTDEKEVNEYCEEYLKEMVQNTIEPGFAEITKEKFDED